MLNCIVNNISWIKDIGTLIFTATATIVGILTYRRARHTILQPIRSETIKKQSELFSRILLFLKSDSTLFEKQINYVELVRVNVLYALHEYGFILKNEKEIFGKIESNVTGWIYVGKSDKINDVEIIQTFKENYESQTFDDMSKGKYEKLKKDGIAEIDKMYITNQYREFLNTMNGFISDPYIPKGIEKSLFDLSMSVNINFTKVMKETIEKFITIYGEKYFRGQDIPTFDPIGIYNDFNHNRIHHNSLINELRNKIREYLLIDKPW